MGIFSFLLSLVNPLTSITKQIADARVELAKAENDYERLKTEERIKQLELRRDVLTTGEWSWLSKLVQALWAAPFIVYAWKVIVYDKVLGAVTEARTDPLGPFEQNLGLMIAGFYFLTLAGGSLLGRFRR